MNIFISLSSANSTITCLHIPHGYVYEFKSPTKAIAFKTLAPSETPLNIAVLSAQFVAPNDAFSTLHPVYILPSSNKAAAPTLKFEYGQYANSLASKAFYKFFFIIIHPPS